MSPTLWWAGRYTAKTPLHGRTRCPISQQAPQLLQAWLQWQKATLGPILRGPLTYKDWSGQGLEIERPCHFGALWNNSVTRLCWVCILGGHPQLPSPSPTFLPHVLTSNISRKPNSTSVSASGEPNTAGLCWKDVCSCPQKSPQGENTHPPEIAE